ncbi:translocation/assembly module TamB domain-containing protein [Gramella sp. AN32]|uniref:Translocation/assembly module TamB domain-containing protein n=1 Tax=Christiangramia antarctica TaxID=2058158 RepID=A0ABW5WY90_9FLAO|nr:translocation/assembly module TamB domain-containing protein [Gramella sp. AN32]MCM4156856.1 hypothetical protein [Gramella sp. AN32]
MANTKRVLFKTLRILGKIILGIIIFLILLILFVRSPWGQNIIKDKFISSVEKKTGATIELEKLFIKFNGDIQIDNLYVATPEGDTIVYSESLSAGIPILPIIRGNSFNLNSLNWENAKLRLIRKDSINGFNYEFLMNAYASDTTATATTPADSTSTMAINIGDIALKNIDLVYRDDVSGIDLKAKLGEMLLEFSETDLANMVFKTNEAYLKNSNFVYNQTKPFPESESEAAPLPFIATGDFSLVNVQGEYNSIPDSLFSDLDIQKLTIQDAEFDLKNNNIQSEAISMSNSEVFLRMKQEAVVQNDSVPTINPEGFSWPEYVFQINKINLENNNIDYAVNNAQVKKGTFDPNALQFQNLTFIASEVYYKDEEARANIEKLIFNEGSGIDVNEFSINALVNNERIELTDINLDANSNTLDGKLVITYPNLGSFINDPAVATLNGSLNNVRLQIKELYRFQPALRENEYIQALAGSPILGNLNVSGKMDNLSLKSLNLRWRNTRIAGSGRIINAQDPENISFNLPNVNVRSKRADLLNFVSEEDLGIKIPENVAIAGSFSGNMNTIKTDTRIETTDGNFNIVGNFETGDNIVFDAKIQGDSIALGNLLQNEALGDLQLNIEITGSGATVNELNAKIDTQITQFSYNNYVFEDIYLTGNIENGTGPLELIYQDPNLDMELQAKVALDSVSSRIDYTLYLDGADLGAIGLAQKSIKTGFVMEGWFQGNAEAYELNTEIIDGVAVYNNKTYLLGSFKASAFVTNDTTSVNIDNRILDLNLQSNASPVDFSKAINRHFKRYITENYQDDSIINPVNLKMRAKIAEAPILTDVFLVNLQELDTVDINVDFSEANRKLDASVHVPFINYFSSEIDSLKLVMNSDPEDLNFDLGWNSITSGPIALKKTDITGVVLNRKLNLDIASSYQDTTLVHLNSEINFQGDTLLVHVNPLDLILNSEEWNVDDDNLLSYDTGYLGLRNFRVYRNDQEMILSNNEPGVEEEHLSLEFKNFNLASFLNYLNPETKLAEGNLNGQLIYEDPFGKTGLLADLQINQFKVLEVDLNTLSLKGESAGFNNYDFEMAIKGGEVDMDLVGNYVADTTSAKLDMNLDLNRVNVSAIEGFSLGYIEDGSGTFSGNMTLNGTVAEPVYSGEFKFDQAKFNIAMLNANFTIPNESMRLDNEGFYFDDFNIKDAKSNSFVLNGKIITEDLINPGFDLDVQAKNFQLLNSTEEDNELFYGKAIVDVDAQITGNLNLPLVNADLNVKETTDFTYVIPETELQIKERDGVVIFVNKEDPNNILTRTEEESYVVSGFDIYMRINIEDGATFNMIINQETGDQFQVEGEGDLVFNMYPSGRMNLAGFYDISDGFYEMTLYNLVTRRFDIADGSRVSWAGDPFDAQLDVQAVYNVETSAASLMAAYTSGIDGQQYRQKLPFLVYLNVDGNLTEPKLTFGLDMPENDQGAAGGQIYGRIQQLNSQEQELNKQVFSLLVLNRFFPGGGSDGSSGGTLAVARDNLNNALSDQLNMLSSRVLGESGVQLNFQVDSFTDYQGESPQERTQLGINAQKAFAGDRLVVEVGSNVDIQGSSQPGQETTPLLGNVSIAYLLDPDGIWRIKGFRRNEFQNVIDGQLIVSGISLIFTKEFNKFKNLFAKAIKEQVEENNAKNASTDNTENEN